MWNCPTEGAVLSMQLSLFYKLESLLCCAQFLNWRLWALWALSTPAMGSGLRLDWKELKVMAFVLLAWPLFPHCIRQEDGQHAESL